MNDAVQRLMAMTDEVVPARLIAPVLKMSESILIHRVKTGQWNEDTLGKVVISGNRVKFFRKDFLQKCGFIEPEPEKEDPTDEILKMLGNLLEGQSTIMRALQLILNDQMNEKTASAATLTERKGVQANEILETL